MEDWAEAVHAAEQLGNWDEAITVLSSVAECGSHDHVRRNAHLWHMDLLAKAGRLAELAIRGETDRHARWRLDRLLYREGRARELRQRAKDGDKYALYLLVRLFRERGDQTAARQAAAEIDKADTYAAQIVTEPRFAHTTDQAMSCHLGTSSTHDERDQTQSNPAE